jgi:uncharacterized membrane protein SpoIIM required for sporulation
MPPSALKTEDIREFPRLYRLVCGHLATAKTLKLSSDVVDFVNNLVAESHQHIYDFPPVERSQIKHYFTGTLPFVLKKNWKYMLISALLFLLPLLATGFVCVLDPGLPSLLLPREFMEQMAASYKNAQTAGRDIVMSTVALTFYMQHNITIAFFSFASGILLGLGTIYFLVYNGIILGAVGGYIISLGYGSNFFNFVTAHSVMELTGLVTAGAAGLYLGATILKSGRYKLKDRLAMAKNNLFDLVATAALMLLVAAAIEGGVSPQPLPYILKILVAIFSLLALWYYFYAIPNHPAAARESEHHEKI